MKKDTDKSEKKPERFRRTSMTVDGVMGIPARINMETGEIKPHKYPVPKSYAKPVALPCGQTNGIVAEGPAWTRIPPPNAEDRVNGCRTTRVTKSNPNNIYLEGFLKYSDAIEELPMLDNLFVGTTSLGNSSRDPINKGILFSMLRDLDEINVKTIMAYTGHSEGHCYKLAQSLRILSTAFDREVDA